MVTTRQVTVDCGQQERFPVSLEGRAKRLSYVDGSLNMC